MIKLEQHKYDHIIGISKQAQTSISDMLDKLDSGTGSVNASVVDAIQNELGQIVIDAATFKTSLANQLESEVEKLQFENKGLNLVQQYSVQRLISELGYIGHFVRTYREMIGKLVLLS